jgi:hypothetical protein
MIAIGLFAVAITWLTVQQTWVILLRAKYFQSEQQMVDFGGRLMTTNKLVNLAALIWWIVWLWLDEPGTKKTPAVEPKPELTESSSEQ